MLIEGGGKARIGLGQFPDPTVGGLRDLLLQALLLSSFLLWGTVNAYGIHRKIPGLGGTDVLYRVPLTGHTAPEANKQQGEET